MHRNSNLPGNMFYKTTTAQSGQINAKMEKDVFKHKIEITWQSQIMHIKIREKEKILHWVRIRAKDFGMKKHSNIMI